MDPGLFLYRGDETMTRWFAIVGGLVGLTSSIACGVISIHSVTSRPPLPPGVGACGNCVIGAFVGGSMLIVASPLIAAVLGAFCGTIGVLFDLLRSR